MPIKKFPNVAAVATKLNLLPYTYRFRINHKTLNSQTFPGPHFGSWTIGNFRRHINAFLGKISSYIFFDCTRQKDAVQSKSYLMPICQRIYQPGTDRDTIFLRKHIGAWIVACMSHV